MNARKKAFLLNFFLDEGIEANLLAQAAYLASESKGLENVKDDKIEDKVYAVLPHLKDDQFKQQFCMERGSFEKLLRLIHGILGRNRFIARVPLDQKLLFTLSLLGGKNTYRQAGQTFGISTSSGAEIYKWMTSAFATLLPSYMNWSNAKCGTDAELPGVVGVIGECRISLRSSIRLEETDKIVRNLAFQAVCDKRYRFLDLFVDLPNEDQQCLLLRSSLYERLIDMEKPFMPRTKHLVGDISYPLLINLMTPYPKDVNLTPCHLAYNQAVYKWQKHCERVFGSCISRFRRLEKLDITNLDVGRRIISACCMLHNFILDCGERIEDSFMNFERHSNLTFEEHNLLDCSYTREAERKRNNLAAKFIKRN
ncbi:protein ALP1-like [Drosophila willistoni]|uniref:protein ALP1-like n=1 Tax=Drosophila willistoni TaxID=7260 RepID=UPI001F07BA50|nr:protein ALP1-like [Drosophila willistoni]